MAKEYKYFTLQMEILRNHDNFEKVGNLLGITANAVRNKLDAKSLWTIDEIDKLCSYYKMDYYELFKKEN